MMVMEKPTALCYHTQHSFSFSFSVPIDGHFEALLLFSFVEPCFIQDCDDLSGVLRDLELSVPSEPYKSHVLDSAHAL